MFEMAHLFSYDFNLPQVDDELNLSFTPNFKLKQSMTCNGLPNRSVFHCHVFELKSCFMNELHNFQRDVRIAVFIIYKIFRMM